MLYIIEDAAKIQSCLNQSGSMIKIRIRNEKSNFEVAVGNSVIRINRYTPE